MSKKTSSIFVCQQCSYQSPSFLGKCPECGTWGSMVEQMTHSQATKATLKRISNTAEIVNIQNIEHKNYPKLISKLDEFNRVLGGGIVVGSVVLVSGDPGIGKSTLLTQIALEFSQNQVSKTEKPATDNRVLYVAGEESAQQIKIRADRIQKNAFLPILNETDVDVIIGTLEEFKPNLVIIDSIQTLETTDLESAAGSVSQVRESAHRLQKLAKKLHIPLLIVGHVTKEGTIAGPKTLEHVVDVVLNLEGDPTTNFRILRTSKNRFGPTDEVGIFEMEETGMIEVKNPSQLFLDEKINAPGSAVVATLSGLRPLLIEIQALVTKSNLAIPRRVGTGIDNNRLQLLVAVLSKRLNLPLYEQDIFVNVTGGLKLSEPAVDLGICMAIISSLKNKPLPEKTLFVGEVGLLGELRKVRSLDRRTTEAKKLGFTKVISPENTKTLLDAAKIVLAAKS